MDPKTAQGSDSKSVSNFLIMEKSNEPGPKIAATISMTNEFSTTTGDANNNSLQMRLKKMRKAVEYTKPGPKVKRGRSEQVLEAFRSGVSAIQISKDYDISRQRAYQIPNQLKGQCIFCSNPAEPGHVRCFKHIQTDEIRENSRRNRGK